jgi:dephospho-CoA kinase
MKHKVIALTGPMGSGKSTALELIKAHGYNTISADLLISVDLYTIYSKEVIAIVGEDCLVGTKVDKKLVANKIYNNENLYNTLSDFLHPYINAKLEELIASSPKPVFVEVPFLFEGNHQTLFDTVICIYTSRERQLKALYARGLTALDIAKRELHHLPLEVKLRRSDFSLYNNSTPESLGAQVYQLLQKLHCT